MCTDATAKVGMKTTTATTSATTSATTTVTTSATTTATKAATTFHISCMPYNVQRHLVYETEFRERNQREGSDGIF